MASRRSRQVSLFDVIPWSVGFAHSWAVRWMLEQPGLAPLVLAAVSDLPGTGAWSVEGPVRHEESVKPRRTDLAFQIRNPKGETHQVALETKVSDPLNDAQLDAYRKAARHPVLFMPGLTGILVAPALRESRTSVLLGSDLVAAVRDALRGEQLVGGYLAGVEQHAKAIADATDSALAGEEWAPPRGLPRGSSSARAYRNAAWVAQVSRGLGRDCSEIWYRATAYDYGYFWDGSRTRIRGRDAFVEISVSHATSRAHVWVKLGGGKGELRSAFDHLRAVGPPADDGRWERCRWGRGESRSVWKATSERRSVAEGIELGQAAAQFLAHHAG